VSTFTKKTARGFTVMEITVTVLAMGIVVAFAAPKIMNGMREYRLNMAMRQVADLIQRVKMQAVSDNRKASLVVDSANLKIGIITYDASNNVLATQYVPLPSGVTFAMPGSNVAPITNAPITKAISFPAQGTSTTIFQQDFNSRGFPAVTAGTINAVYLTNGRTYRALTMNSVTGIATFTWTGNGWKDVRR
jgi:Tfp pilus assembly protein FimT